MCIAGGAGGGGNGVVAGTKQVGAPGSNPQTWAKATDRYVKDGIEYGTFNTGSYGHESHTIGIARKVEPPKTAPTTTKTGPEPGPIVKPIDPDIAKKPKKLFPDRSSIATYGERYYGAKRKGTGQTLDPIARFGNGDGMALGYAG